MITTYSNKRQEFLRNYNIRHQLKKRTAPNQRSYVVRMSNNSFTKSYTGHEDETSKFIGSTLIKQFNEKKKMERTALFEEMEKRAKANGCYMEEFTAWKRCSEDVLLRKNYFTQQANKRDCPFPVDGVALPSKRKRKRMPGMSIRTRSKVMDKAAAFWDVLGDQATFLTLTFIADVSEKRSMQIWNKFRTTLAASSSEKLHYLIVKEFQKSGRIHFHVMLNRRINIKKFNALWVLCQYNAGLTYKGVSKREINQRYNVSLESKNKFRCSGSIEEILNPLHIEKINSLHGLHHYLVKYIAKNETKFFKHGTWHCSRSVSKMFTKTIIHQDHFNEARTNINTRVNPKTGELHEFKESIGPFWHTIYIANRQHFHPLLSEMIQVNRWILEGMELDKIPVETDYSIRKYFMNHSPAEVDRTYEIAKEFINRFGFSKERILATDISYFASSQFSLKNNSDVKNNSGGKELAILQRKNN